MTALTLLADLQARGVLLSAEDDRLSFDAPAGVMTPDVKAALKARKPELLAILAGRWKDAARLMIGREPDADRRADLREWLGCPSNCATLTQLGNFIRNATFGNFQLASRSDAERAALEQLADAMEGGGR
jgi:hypothetical protein